MMQEKISILLPTFYSGDIVLKEIQTFISTTTLYTTLAEFITWHTSKTHIFISKKKIILSLITTLTY